MTFSVFTERGCASVSSERPFTQADFDQYVWSDETMNTPRTNAALDAELGNPESMAVSQLSRDLETRLVLMERAYWIATGLNPSQNLGPDSMGKPLTDEEIISQAELTANRCAAFAKQLQRVVRVIEEREDGIYHCAIRELASQARAVLADPHS